MPFRPWKSIRVHYTKREMRISLLFLCILSFWHLQVQGQESEVQYYKWQVSTQLHRGFIWLHRDGLEHIPEEGTRGIALDISQQSNGSKDWHLLYNLPKVGLSILWFDFGSSYLGQSAALIPYYAFTHKRKEKLLWRSKIGMGLGYINTTWNRTENHKNVMIGSHLNLAVQLQTELAWKLTDQLHLETGLSFTHFSNGGTTKPNLGINMPSAFAGLNYAWSPMKTKQAIARIYQPIHKREFTLGLAGFLNQYKELGDHYLASTISLEYARYSKNSKNRFHAGLDGFYNEEISDSPDNVGKKLNASDFFELGLNAGYSRNIGRVSGIFSLGIYLYSKELKESLTYNRIGLRYNINRSFYANFTTKTHQFKADHFELGIGYRLWKD